MEANKVILLLTLQKLRVTLLSQVNSNEEIVNILYCYLALEELRKKSGRVKSKLTMVPTGIW